MEESPPTVAEQLVMALAVTLYRKGILDLADAQAMHDELTAKAADATGEAAERLEAAAHLANVIILEGAAEFISRAEWAAGRARSRLRVVEGGED